MASFSQKLDRLVKRKGESSGMWAVNNQAE